MTPTEAARLSLTCLDLTSLNDADTEADIARLCERARAPLGPVAAVCVWPRLAAFARAQLPAHIGVAAVANFPDSRTDVERAVRDTDEIVQAGAQEVDVVLPWRALQAGDAAAVAAVLRSVRRTCEGLTLKVILESGELGRSGDTALIARASQLALAEGADFLKTSTGKTAHHASLPAAEAMLAAIAADPLARDRVGLKPSGGLRTVADVQPYLALVVQHLGAGALNPKRFRIGASSLYADIEAILQGSSTAPDHHAY
ncbi:MAG: deoxyribose-phosphate aldolase [Sphaerotilus sp.]|nr:deoxyribose-phosphate aldolase [Sphaerotilus sp.]